MTRRFFRRCFFRLILRQECSRHCQSCDPKNQIIPLHDAPSSNHSKSLKVEATLEPSYSLYLRLQFPPLLPFRNPRDRHKVQVPILHFRNYRTFDPGNTVC